MQEFDGVIIGSGQHGLILGTYLARAGLRVAVLERKLMYGGGLQTYQPGTPGFYHNFHSINHFNISKTPWYRDLQLRERGVRYITAHYDFASPQKDGTALVFSRDAEETIGAIARFSKKDAKKWREWNSVADPISDAIFLPERYSEPLPENERDDLLSQSELGRAFLKIIDRQPLKLVTDEFEHERVRMLLLFKLSLFGTILTEAVTTRSPMGASLRAFDIAAGYEVCEGGSFNLARGLMESFIASGGTFINRAHVARILIEGGSATGVELEDGRTIRARQFVASTVDVPQTFTKMVGLDRLPADYRAKIERFKQTKWGLYGFHLSLRESPKYKAAAFDPHVNEALKYNIGIESVEQIMAQQRQVGEGKIPRPLAFGAGNITVLDPTQAPRGNATGYGWMVVPYAPDGDPSNFDTVKWELYDQLIELWSQYAPNVKPSNIIDHHVWTPYDYTRDLINMVEGDIFMGSFSGEQTMWNHFGYRTPVRNLYMAGSPTHPGGAVSGGGGYIASRVIAEDLGARVWWSPIDARKSLQALAQGERVRV
jgi:phytoene dehydrogenase-like protein